MGSKLSLELIFIKYLLIFIYFVFYSHTCIINLKEALNREIYVSVLNDVDALHALKHTARSFCQGDFPFIRTDALLLVVRHSPRIGVIVEYNGAKTVLNIFFSVKTKAFLSRKFSIA